MSPGAFSSRASARVLGPGLQSFGRESQDASAPNCGHAGTSAPRHERGSRHQRSRHERSRHLAQPSRRERSRRQCTSAPVRQLAPAHSA
eukprot:170479-Alexandrium_andersonii.AAC.1